MAGQLHVDAWAHRHGIQLDFIVYNVDGAWYNDTEDNGRIPTGWGNEYSLKTVQ